MATAHNYPVPNAVGVATLATGPASSAINKDGIIFASQARDATGASGGSASGVYVTPEIHNPDARGVRLNIVIAPTGAATGQSTFVVQIPDPVSSSISGTVWTNLVGTGAGTGFVVNGTGALTGAMMTIYPGLTGIADSSGALTMTINQHLGPRWRLQATLANASLTFTVGGDYLL